jgi:TolB-like protein
MLAATTGWVVPASARTSETDDRRVVVEPFANVSGADDDAWIGDGIADGGIWPIVTTCMCGPMASTSTFDWRTTGSAPWW